MEARLVLFLGLTCLVLIGNTVAMWLAYKTFANVTTKVTETFREFGNDPTTREWLKLLEDASTNAVIATNAVKQQVLDFEPVLAKAQTRVEFALAQADVRFERFCDAFSDHAERTQNAIVKPAEKIAEAAAGLEGVLQFSGLVGVTEIDSDATSTQNR
jgi:hypothetical protein